MRSEVCLLGVVIWNMGIGDSDGYGEGFSPLQLESTPKQNISYGDETNGD